jgi:hypothetical protein
VKITLLTIHGQEQHHLWFPWLRYYTGSAGLISLCSSHKARSLNKYCVPLNINKGKEVNPYCLSISLYDKLLISKRCTIISFTLKFKLFPSAPIVMGFSKLCSWHHPKQSRCLMGTKTLNRHLYNYNVISLSSLGHWKLRRKGNLCDTEGKTDHGASVN